MKQNHILDLILMCSIFHLAFSMENNWEKQAQDIKNMYIKARNLEFVGQNNEAFKLYIEVANTDFPSIPETQNFKEIFQIKEKATKKTNGVQDLQNPITLAISLTKFK